MSKIRYIQLAFCFSFIFIFNITNADDSERLNIFFEYSGVYSALALSPVFIEEELSKLSSLKKTPSEKQIDTIRQKLLIRFHPDILQSEISSLFQKQLAQQEHHYKAFVALHQLYQSSFSMNLHSLSKEASTISEKQNLLNYYDRILTEPPQSHRVSIARTYDGLNHMSKWQILLLENIQLALSEELNAAKKQPLERSELESLKNQMIEYQTIMNLYAFKSIPSESFVPYFDELAKIPHQHVFLELEHSFNETLIQRRKLDIQL